MKFHPQSADGNLVESLPAGGGGVVAGVLYEGGVVVAADWVWAQWRGLDAAGGLDAAALAAVAERAVAGDVVLLGWGEVSPLPRAEWAAPFVARGVGFEAMSLRAACRTYNIMAADGRQVIAALIL